MPPYVAAALLPGLETPNEFRAIVNAHFKIAPPKDFPRLLGILLIVLGALLSLRALRLQGSLISPWKWRPTLVVLGASFTAGNIIDTQMGFGMVNVFDPQSGAQVAVTGNLLNVVLLLCFFATSLDAWIPPRPCNRSSPSCPAN